MTRNTHKKGAHLLGVPLNKEPRVGIVQRKYLLTRD